VFGRLKACVRQGVREKHGFAAKTEWRAPPRYVGSEERLAGVGQSSSMKVGVSSLGFGPARKPAARGRERHALGCCLGVAAFYAVPRIADVALRYGSLF